MALQQGEALRLFGIAARCVVAIEVPVVGMLLVIGMLSYLYFFKIIG